MSTTKDKSQAAPLNNAMSEMNDKVSRYFDNQRKSEELERHHRKIKTDSITTYNTCGKFPSELLADREELVKALLQAKYRIERCTEKLEKVQRETGIPSEISMLANDAVVEHITDLLTRITNP